MIEFAIAFLPFILCMLLARSLGRRGRTGPRMTIAPRTTRQPLDPGVAAAAHAGRSAALSPVPPLDDIGAEAPPAWSALDDLQLRRLLDEASA